jgi:hypothetical protein
MLSPGDADQHHFVLAVGEVADGNPLGLGPAVDCRHIRFTDVAEGSR